MTATRILDWDTIKVFINLIISFSSGFLIGATEIISTFQYRRKLFKMFPVISFLGFYGLLGTLAFLLVSYQDADYLGNTMIAFVTGISPHVILRSRFSIIRSRDETGEKKLDLSLDLEQVFNTWVKFFKNRIDVSFMEDQRRLIDLLIRKYPTTEEMLLEISRRILTLQAMDAKEREEKLKAAGEIFQSAKDLNDENCLRHLAGMIVQISDFDALQNELTGDKPPLPPADDVSMFISTYPDFLNKIDTWKSLLSDKEQRYLEQIILSADLTDKGKAEMAAKFLVSRKKLNNVISKLKG